MGLEKKWRQGKKLITKFLALSFRSFTIAILSLLLPLSFLLLAKLSLANRLSTTFSPHPTYASLIVSLLIDTTPPLIHTLVLFISLVAFLQTFTGRTIRLHLCIAWTLLCVVQTCVGMGIQASTLARVWQEPSTGIFPQGAVQVTVLPRLLFFAGLYQTTVFWASVIVRPLVDDTIYGEAEREETRLDHAAVGLAFGALWWWRLRKELDVLCNMVKMKRLLLMEVQMLDIFCWLVYYVTVMVGIERGIAWVVKLVNCRQEQEITILHDRGGDDKV